VTFAVPGIYTRCRPWTQGKLYLSLGGKAEAGRPPVMFPLPTSHYTIRSILHSQTF